MDFSAFFQGVPLFLEYLVVGFVLLAMFFVVYLWITPQDELHLIRTGNGAAALSLAGAVIGFILPLGIVIAEHAEIANVALWGLVALVVQVLAFFLARGLMPGLPKAITEGKISIGAFSGLVSLAIGILNAACQTD
jgi:putative membrane protein